MANSTIYNSLIHEKSPYLLQHAHNPVDWRPWGDEAFEEAKHRDVPIFLSIGYSSCHWCHVMERECFEDQEVAAFLNNNFVSIKVDREERPDVDHIYMEACVALTGSGGWPLSCFLDHDRRPFFVGTYFPKHSTRGLPGFLSVLDTLTTLWKADRERIASAAESLTDAIQSHGLTAKGSLDGDACDTAYEHFDRSYDERYGGFGTAPKFPSAHSLLFLMRYGVLNKQPQAEKMVRGTLEGMAAGGIFDHIAGGFCRYSTDSRWLVPHFEKMLYDNAMLSIAYAEASAAYGQPEYAHIARRTLDYCLREMLGEHGGFYTAQDADSEGEEGKHYVWTPAQVSEALGESNGARFCKLFGITETGNFEGKSIPNTIGRTLTDDEKGFAEQCFPRLLATRMLRPQPFKDDKAPASGNSLMIAALSVCGRLLNEQRYIAQAEKTADFVLNNLVNTGRLMSAWREGVTAHPATSDDYAYFVWGLLELYQATLNPDWLEEAVFWADAMLELFWDNEAGGLFLSGSDVSGLPLRPKNLSDGALPSGNSVAALTLLRLARATGREEYENKSNEILDSLAEIANAYPSGNAALLCAKLYEQNLGTEVIIAAGNGLEEMIHATLRILPFTVVAVRGKGYEKMDELAPAYIPMDAKTEAATAYVCSRGACQQPVTDPNALSEKLKTVF